MNDASTPFLTIAEAALRLRVSRSKLYQLASRREIPHYRIGGKILFTPEQLQAFLARCQVAAKPLAVEEDDEWP